MNYDEVITLWGRNLLRSKGFDINDNDNVSVELVTEEQGYCDTCAYTTVAVEVSVNSRKSYSFNDYEFQKILEELIALSVENSELIINS